MLRNTILLSSLVFGFGSHLYGMGLTQLHKAAMNGTPEYVKSAIQNGYSVHQVDNMGRTPLLIASDFNENPEVTKVLIEQGSNVNQTNNPGWTPLHEAIMGGNTRVVQELLEAGANIHKTATNDSGTYTPLQLSRKYQPSNIETISQLIAYDTNINISLEQDKLQATVEDNQPISVQKISDILPILASRNHEITGLLHKHYASFTEEQLRKILVAAANNAQHMKNNCMAMKGLVDNSVQVEAFNRLASRADQTGDKNPAYCLYNAAQNIIKNNTDMLTKNAKAYADTFEQQLIQRHHNFCKSDHNALSDVDIIAHK